ncbi:MAG: flippase-like domain-containing protein [Nitrospirae bacterium]|nr:flippase-like domain-containing protein [Nitrospirota bacterium]
MKVSWRSLLLILKLAVSSALLYLLINKIGGGAIIEKMRLMNPLCFALAIILYLIASYLSSKRWKLLLPQRRISARRLFSLYMIGSFFNSYLPGIVGGDAVKAFYLARELKSSDSAPAEGIVERDNEISASFASVFMDRYIGLSALLFIGVMSAPLGIGYITGEFLKLPFKLPVAALIIVFFAGFLMVSVFIFKFRLGERLKFLFKVYEHFRFYSQRREILFSAFIYSLLIQILSIGAVYILSVGISLNVPFVSLFYIVPTVILISFIPVSISGIGLREGAFVLLLGAYGTPPDSSVTLSLMWFLSSVAASLWGLIEYLRLKTDVVKPALSRR